MEYAADNVSKGKESGHYFRMRRLYEEKAWPYYKWS